jgi:hypothetical protein
MILKTNEKKDLVDEFLASNMSKSEFCAARNLKFSTFCKWIKFFV